ncbi:MAG: hypothetical protein HC837_13280 [Chloroflexaceae bacterium]|nr:hypothetical protein [Chloroflexaceae bacterium]
MVIVQHLSSVVALEVRLIFPSSGRGFLLYIRLPRERTALTIIFTSDRTYGNGDME